jgi:hypothetical protein
MDARLVSYRFFFGLNRISEYWCTQPFVGSLSFGPTADLLIPSPAIALSAAAEVGVYPTNSKKTYAK